MADSRIKEFTDFYHKQYQDVTGVKYKWKGGKEQKLMQGCIKYFDSLKTGSDGLEHMKKACSLFLDTDDKFIIERAYDLSDFLTKPERWAYDLRVKEEKDARRRVNEKALEKQKHKSAQEVRQNITGKDWLEQMAENPQKFIKSFKLVHKLMKTGDPDLYKKVRGLMVEFYGKEKLNEYWGKC